MQSAPINSSVKCVCICVSLCVYIQTAISQLISIHHQAVVVLISVITISV